MTILMRPSLIDTTHHCNDAHAGLLLTRGLTEWQTGEKTLKAALIDKVASVQSNTLYKKAFERWLNTTFNRRTCNHRHTVGMMCTHARFYCTACT